MNLAVASGFPPSEIKALTVEEANLLAKVLKKAGRLK